MRPWALALALALAAPPAAVADEVHVLAARAVEKVVPDLAEAFRRETGHAVSFTFGTAGAMQAKAAAGEAADLVILGAQGAEALERRGVVSAGSRVTVGRVAVGLATRAGAPRPDILTPEALRNALLAARSIAYADPARGGQGGTLFAALVERLGLADALVAKTSREPDGITALERVARGEIELGAAPVSEIVAIPGLALVGPVPASLAPALVYTAGILVRSRAPAAAAAFVRYVTGPAGRTRLAAAGFEP